MDAGSVRLDLRLAAGSIAGVAVQVRRPALAPLLAGRPAASAAGIVPLLYAVCAQAQGAAATAATAAARGEAMGAHIDAAVRAEAAGELVLAVMTGEARAFAAQAHRAVKDPPALAQLLEGALLDMPLDQWLALSAEAPLVSWAEAGHAPLARELHRRLLLTEPRAHPPAPLPVLTSENSTSFWPVLTPAFSLAPSLHGRAAETGPVARLADQPLVRALADRPLVQRWIARLIEIAEHARGGSGFACGRVTAAVAGAGRGRAAVETARGSLLHEISLSGDRIDGYVIVAPTEWNFHADGPLRDWLNGMPAASPKAACRLAARAVEALDPCVECRYTVDGAAQCAAVT